MSGLKDPRLANYPGVGLFNGYYRFRRGKNGKPLYTKLEPLTEAFDAWYEACITGTTAKVIHLKRGAVPESFEHAWQELRGGKDWQESCAKTRANQQPVLEAWLDSRVEADNPLLWRETLMKNMRFRHAQESIDNATDMFLAYRTAQHATLSPEQQRSDQHKLRPNRDAGRLLHVCLRKLFKIALLKDWVEADPTARCDVTRPNPELSTWKPWSFASMRAFEAHFPYGTQERTLYELAKWLGTRRSDCGLIAWEQLDIDEIEGVDVLGFTFLPYKTRKSGKLDFQPMTEELARALAHIPESERKGVILKKLDGGTYATDSLSGMMYNATRAAGLDEGHILHGLRKNNGKDMAHGGATLREGMAGGGWATPAEFLRYSLAYEQKVGAVKAKAKVVDLRRRQAERHLQLVRKVG